MPVQRSRSLDDVLGTLGPEISGVGFRVTHGFRKSQQHLLEPYMGVSENWDPLFSTLNSSILILFKNAKIRYRLISRKLAYKTPYRSLKGTLIVHFQETSLEPRVGWGRFEELFVKAQSNEAVDVQLCLPRASAIPTFG